MIENGNKSENINLLEVYKKTKLSNLLTVVLEQKNRASILLDELKEKKAAFLAKLEEEQKKAEAVEDAPKQAEVIAEVKVEAKETVPQAEVVLEVPAAAVVEQQLSPAASVVEVVKAEQTQKPKKEKKAKEGVQTVRNIDEHVAEITGPDGAVRRVYIPPEKTVKPEKKPAPAMGSGVQTRVFANGYQRERTQVNRAPRPMTGARPNLASMPAPMPTPGKTPSKTPQKKTGAVDDKKGNMNKRQLMKRGYIVDSTLLNYDDEDGRIRSKKQKKGGGYETVDTTIDKAFITTPTVTIKTLSEKIGKTGAVIIQKLFLLDIIKRINDVIDFDTAKLVSAELNVDLEYKPEKTFEDTLTERVLTDEVDDIENLKPRPPVVTIMGHVDHGKTSLLDYIRKANVAGGEAGGITQHIGAYTVKLKGQSITFLDTPGHEAFTAMRARGAQVTDIAVIVIAADDGIMPQTIEAIDHARSANVSIVVAVNKMDKPHADYDRILQQLSQHEVLTEEWGGDIPVVKVSAKTGMGIEHLLETILLVAEVKELKANPNRNATGNIIEARLDKGKGPIATILVDKGTLKTGDYVVAGTCVGKIRSMADDKGRRISQAGPSIPVSVMGFEEVPNAGDDIKVVDDEKFAKQLAEERKLKLMSESADVSRGMSLDEVFSNYKSGLIKELTLILKADVQGSLEAVKQSLSKLGNAEVKIKIIHGGVGGIKESDVILANTTGSIIIGFNVRPDVKANELAAKHHIDIRSYRIIYEAIEDIEKAVKGMLAPEFKEVLLGTAEIRELFKISGVGTIAGCHVLDGKILRNAKVRVVREGTIVFDGSIASLKHEKEDVKEIAKNYDCGILINNFNDVKKNDIIEAYNMEQIVK